jgi:hypothetical protein
MLNEVKHVKTRRVKRFGAVRHGATGAHFSRGVYPERSEGLLHNDKWFLLGQPHRLHLASHILLRLLIIQVLRFPRHLLVPEL